MEPTQHESKSSVEISRNARGETQFSIKVYRDPGKEDEAATEASRIYEDLTKLYYPVLGTK